MAIQAAKNGETRVAVLVCGPESMATETINYDQVQPFAQPEPVSDAEKAAVKFKPQLTISGSCKPYPAVDSSGSISGGLKWSDSSNDDCAGSPLGSQVYSRSGWYSYKWGIMYTWYFPKAQQPYREFSTDSRHMWLWAIVWIDDPADDDSTVQGLSMSAIIGHQRMSPVLDYYINGSSVKLESYVGDMSPTSEPIQETLDAGETQDLIQWDQLTDAARESLSSFDFAEGEPSFRHHDMPLEDSVFNETLKNAYPFCRRRFC
ncbi:hypothetical protein BBO99_00009022 [Phytophthora kernoviae]|uniref:Necrosis inducing-like protein NPP1 type n=2 Tax=Phytophthora kernoviae TaxID=325452 RepID=A0A3R7J2R1_9STRA|nr:hypothetical protein G195_009917 [Phytophthora kernoviae 00238/432]KAG2511019.1 hypothetical protein JM16_008285 [Phytophthora kernoviae]KAG2514637.1 hypothetical protein JM18_008268 [Phytophthora kernoviae]RLN15079.1 hypothetical protein BBI17_009033 [Phytophthora kernoviae]RLN74250.1 hypothetical protein BBO99_00009022 [Phytophthora kernoviae]